MNSARPQQTVIPNLKRLRYRQKADQERKYRQACVMIPYYWDSILCLKSDNKIPLLPSFEKTKDAVTVPESTLTTTFEDYNVTNLMKAYMDIP